MPHTGSLNGQTVVGTSVGFAAGLYQSFSSVLESDVAHAMLLAACGACAGFAVTETLKALKKPTASLIVKLKKKLF